MDRRLFPCWRMSSPSLVIMLLLMNVLIMVTVLVSVEALRSTVAGATGRYALGRRPFSEDEATLEVSELSSESTSDSKEKTGLTAFCSPCSGAG